MPLNQTSAIIRRIRLFRCSLFDKPLQTPLDLVSTVVELAGHQSRPAERTLRAAGIFKVELADLVNVEQITELGM